MPGRRNSERRACIAIGQAGGPLLARKRREKYEYIPSKSFGSDDHLDWTRISCVTLFLVTATPDHIFSLRSRTFLLRRFIPVYLVDRKLSSLLARRLLTRAGTDAWTGHLAIGKDLICENCEECLGHLLDFAAPAGLQISRVSSFDAMQVPRLL